MKRKMKIELSLALIIGLTLSIFTVYINQPRYMGNLYPASLKSTSYSKNSHHYSSSETVQIVKENIHGKLRKGSFETVVEELRNITAYYRGRIPYLSMIYENELWKGTLKCKVPTENVTSFTFGVRQLINRYGKVIYITITVTEVEINQTGQSEEPLSEINISLEEFIEGESSIVNQIGMVVPWLVNSLIWIAQGLIIGVPLCFASLGVVLIISRGIIPAWRNSLKGIRKSEESTAAV